MAHGHHQDKTAHDPSIRAMFTRESLLASDWYQKRLRTRQLRDVSLWKRHVDYLTTFATDERNAEDVERLKIVDRLDAARAELQRVSASGYAASLVGTVGADPM
jgi:hypothetical protein